MKKKLSPHGLFALTTLGMSLCSIISLTLSYVTAYDSAIGYFSTGAILPSVSTVLALLFTAGIVGDAILILRTHKEPLCLENPLWLRVVSALVGVGLFGVAIIDLLSSATLFTVLVGILAGVHFLLRALKPKLHLPLTLTGIAVIVRLTLSIGQLYFNWELPMNAPLKVYLQLGCVAAMFFLLRDMKATVCPSRSLVTLLSFGLGTLFTGAASLPTLIAFLRGDLGEADIRTVPFLLLLLWLYCLARMLTLLICPNAPHTDSESPTQEDTPTETEAPDSDPS